jgi:hypothetical protein
LYPEKLLTVDLGKNAEFSCFDGQEKSVTITWMKDGSLLRSTGETGKVRFMNQNRILSITSVDRNDQGM